MLERFILLASNVSVVLLAHTSVPMLTGLELAASKEGRDLLKNVANVITELEAEKYSISGKVVPLLKLMKKVWLSKKLLYDF